MKQLLDRPLVGARWLTLGVAGVWTLACSNAHSLGSERREDVGTGGTASSAGGTGGFAAQDGGGQGGSGGGGSGEGGSGGTAGAEPDPDPGDPGASCPLDCSGPGGALVRIGVPSELVRATGWVAVVCHKDNCVTLDAKTITSNLPNSNVTVTCAGKDRVYTNLVMEVGIPENPPYTLFIEWGFAGGTVLTDGDEYSIEVKDGGRVVMTSKQRAHYEPAASACATGDQVIAVIPNVQDEVCALRDVETAGCMFLGGSAPGCFRTCDFWCSENWRVEFDEHGCEGWRYDYNPGICDAGGTL